MYVNNCHDYMTKVAFAILLVPIYTFICLRIFYFSYFFFFKLDFVLFNLAAKLLYTSLRMTVCFIFIRTTQIYLQFYTYVYKSHLFATRQ